MKHIFRLFALVALSIVCVNADATSKTLQDFVSKVSASSVSFDYSYKATMGKTKMSGSGNVKVKGNAFIMKGDGMEIWCDGKTRWSIDEVAEEAVIENVSDADDAITANPALLIVSLNEKFSEASSSASTFQGHQAMVSVLTPLKKDSSSMGISQLKLYFKPGTQTLVGAEVKLNDGTQTTMTISALKFIPLADEKESFRFNEKTLNSSYVITDLR